MTKNRPSRKHVRRISEPSLQRSSCEPFGDAGNVLLSGPLAVCQKGSGAMYGPPSDCKGKIEE